MADVLVIDDDKLICDLLARMMKTIGHETRWALTGKEGLELVKNGVFDIVFLDVNLPDTNGLDLIASIKASTPSPEIIIITGDTDRHGAEMAMNSGAWNYLEKPFLRQEINLQVSRALQFRKEKGKVSTPGMLKRNGIIGESKRIRTCLDQVGMASHSDAPVLISGEKGTGKELFAKTIHLNSDRCENNFVIVDSSLVKSTVFERVLFGYEKGAFPSAVGDRPGLIGQANNGTLFLDDVSAFPLKVQKILLDVIENQTFMPAGTKEEKTSNFRVISTTRRNLVTLCDRGKFNKDFLLKLEGIRIDLPPLKEMKKDIIKIALFYIDQYCKKYKIDTKGVSPEFLDIIDAYEWPGNVRELVNTMNKAIASAKNEPTLYSIHLPWSVKETVIKKASLQSRESKAKLSHPYAPEEFPLLKKVMEATEKEYLAALLSHTGKDVKKACDISGVSVSAMYARVKKYHLT